MHSKPHQALRAWDWVTAFFPSELGSWAEFSYRCSTAVAADTHTTVISRWVRRTLVWLGSQGFFLLKGPLSVASPCVLPTQQQDFFHGSLGHHIKTRAVRLFSVLAPSLSNVTTFYWSNESWSLQVPVKKTPQAQKPRRRLFGDRQGPYQSSVCLRKIFTKQKENMPWG